LILIVTGANLKDPNVKTIVEKKTHIFRVIEILTLICIITVSCSTTEDLSMRPLYSFDKYKIEGSIQGTLFREQLLIAKELGPTDTTVVTLEKYAHGRQAIYG